MVVTQRNFKGKPVMRNTLRIALLLAALAIPAYAGDMPNGATGEPPPEDPIVMEQKSTTSGWDLDTASPSQSTYLEFSNVLYQLLIILF